MEEELIALNALVIDDSRVMRSMVIQSLKQTELAAFEFSEAENGSDAMGKLDEKTFDIIFCDWNMPGMNGIEFARHVRQTPWIKHIPVIMITSETGDAKQKDAYDEARITCYITKPFTVESIKEKIAPVIEELAKKSQQAQKSAPAAAVAAKPAGGFFSKLLS